MPCVPGVRAVYPVALRRLVITTLLPQSTVTAAGAATYAGADGSRQPSELELNNGKAHGAYFAGVAKKLAAK